MPRAPETHQIVRRSPDEKQRDQRNRQQQEVERRGTAAERGYGARWQAARAGFLRKHPLCCAHLANGRAEPATVVDHIEPHKGDADLFWARDNWQPLCAWCHAHVKPVLERRYVLGLVDRRDLALARPLPEFFVDPI